MKDTKQEAPKHIIEIVRDDDPPDPRAWDNGCVMLCRHSCSVLGDEDAQDKIEDIIRKHPKYDPEWGEEIDADGGENDSYLDICDPQGLCDMLDKLGIPWLPLYLYNHGGITMNTTGFQFPRDSWQAGIIVIDPSEYGGDNAEDYLRNEVKTYDQYLQGDTYGVRIFEACPCCGEKVEQIDATFGFCGDDFENNGAKEFICGEHGESQADFEAAVIRGARITN